MQQTNSSEVRDLRARLRKLKDPAERGETLLALSEAVGNSQLDEAYTLAEQALECSAGPTKSPHLSCRAHARAGRVAWLLGRLPQAEAHHTASLSIAVSLGSERDKAVAWQGLASVHVYRGEYEQARQLIEDSLPIARQLGDSKLVTNSLINLSVIHSNLADYVRSLEYAEQAVCSAQSAGDLSQEAHCLAALGAVYAGLGDFARAMDAKRQAAEIAERSGVEQMIAATTMTLGGAYMDEGEFELAEACLKRAKEANPQMKPRDRAVLTLSTGELAIGRARQLELENAGLKGSHARSCVMKLAREALAHFKIGREITSQIQNRRLTAIAHKDLAEAYVLLGRLDAAARELEAALEIDRAIKEKKLEADALELAMRVYERQGNLSGALAASRELGKVRSAVFLEDQNRKTARTEARQQIDAARRERELAEARALHLESRARELEAEVERKQRELTGMALELAEKGELVQSVKRDTSALLAHYGHERTEESRRLRETLERFESSAAQKWSEFETGWQELNKGLYETLSTRAPKLTPTEMKVCALLRVGLGSKEIGKILFVSNEAIYNYRFHIREKLSLPPGTALTNYLRSLGPMSVT